MEENRTEEKKPLENPEEIARLFKYLRQDYNPIIVRKLPLEMVPFKNEYQDNRRCYDKLQTLSNKYGIDLEKYFIFCLDSRRVQDIRETLDIHNIQGYVTHLREEEHLKGVYRGFLKTQRHIAEVCSENDMTASEYLNWLVRTNTLGYEYYAGNISKYFLAGIDNFKEMYDMLDTINKEELSIVYEASGQLRDELCESLKRFGPQD